MDASTMSPADIMALSGDKNSGFLGGNAGGILALIIVFILLFGGNGMWGNGNTATALGQAQLQQDLFSQTQDANIRQLSQGQCDLTSQIMQNKYEGAIQTMNAQNAVTLQLQAMSAQQAQCCCTVQREIDGVNYNNAQNTAAIIQAANANTQRILDAQCADKIQELRDKLQTAQLDANNAAQTATLINTLRPVPQPAYITCSPYAAASTCMATA